MLFFSSFSPLIFLSKSSFSICMHCLVVHDFILLCRTCPSLLVCYLMISLPFPSCFAINIFFFFHFLASELNYWLIDFFNTADIAKYIHNEWVTFHWWLLLPLNRFWFQFVKVFFFFRSPLHRYWWYQLKWNDRRRKTNKQINKFIVIMCAWIFFLFLFSLSMWMNSFLVLDIYAINALFSLTLSTLESYDHSCFSSCDWCVW